MKEGAPNSEEGDGAISRRKFLQGALSAAGTVALPELFSGQVLAEEKPDIRAIPSEEDIAFVRTLKESPRTWNIFRYSATEAQVARVMRVLNYVIRNWAYEEAYKGSELHAGANVIRNDEGAFIGNSTILQVRKNGENQYVEVTAAHVIAGLRDEQDWTPHPEGLDIVARRVPETATQDIGALPFSLTQAEQDTLDWQPALVLGRDSDTGTLERKPYATQISPHISAHLLQCMNANVTPTGGNTERHDPNRLHLAVLPDSEADTLPTRNVKAQGMSGAAALYMPPGARGVRFGGVFLAVGRKDIENEWYTFGLLLDQREAAMVIGACLNDHVIDNETADWDAFNSR